MIICKICNPNFKGNGYCAEHSTGGTAYSTPVKPEECEVFKKTGGHYYTERGMKMCCEKSAKPDEWYEAEFDKFEGCFLRHSDFRKVKDFICHLLLSERKKIVEEIEKITEEEIKKEPNLEIGSGMAHLYNIIFKTLK